MLGHLDPLVPGQGPPKLFGKSPDRLSDRIANGAGPGTRDRRAAVHSWAVVTFDRREMQQHREPTGALDQSPDRRAVHTKDQIALPVARHSTVINLSRPLADQQLISHKAAVAPRCPVPGSPQRPTCPQASGQFAAQRSPALDIQRLIDRLVGHAHRLIIGEVQAQPLRDLLRAPALSPTAILPRSLTPPPPCDIRTRDAPIRPLHRARKPGLHIRPAPHSLRASPAWDVEHDAQHASGRSRLDTQRGHVRSPHCVATLGRSSTAHGRADARSLAPHNHARAEPRSPPAR